MRFFKIPSQEEMEDLVYFSLLEEEHTKNSTILFYYTINTFIQNQFDIYFIHPKTGAKGQVCATNDFSINHEKHPVAEKLMLCGVLPTWISKEEPYATWREKYFIPHLAVFSAEDIDKKRIALKEDNGMTRHNAFSISS